MMPIKILIVDDSKSDRLIIENMLSEDYRVLTACDGLEAMRVLEAHDDISLLILDLDMPVMDGFQVLEALNESSRFEELRTIVLTDSDESDGEIRALRLGAADYLRKPVHREQLRVRVELHATLINAKQALEQKTDEETLAFDLIFNQAPIGITISHNYDPLSAGESNIRINSMYELITGRKKEELVSLGWAKITHPEDLKREMQLYRRLLAGEIKSYAMDKRLIRPDGTVVWVHIIVAPFKISSDRKYNHICLTQDITERKKIEKALMESERSKSVILSHLPGLAYRCKYDPEWTMMYVSKGCLNLTGYSPESLLQNREVSYNEIISPEYRELLLNEWAKVLPTKKQFKYEYEIITKSGEKKWVLELGQGVYNEQGEVEALEGIVIDISDKKAVEDTLKYNNEHDRWTGLYNREYLETVLANDAELKKSQKRALIGINLNTVQLITADYGFQYTQNLIKKAAEALSGFCSEERMLFYAFYNRFVFYILDYEGKDELIRFAQTVASTLETLFLMERIGGGIGILEIGPDDEADSDTLFRHLLVASEKAVSEEKDFAICFYDDKLQALVNRERDIMDALSAIAADAGGDDQIYLQYQPISNIKTGLVCGFEALARLRTEKLGLVPPMEFIPIAEKTKLIIRIGEKVIVNAFRFLNRLKEQGYDNVSVSINISIIQLLHPGFTVRLFELIREMQVDPKNICLEITESVFASDYEVINKSLEKLKGVGMHVAIDDFGVGYSSLAREKELKADFMKIDKYFVDNLLREDPSKAITSDIISISRKLGHCIIAEGVEHEVQLKYLKDHNCDRIQGYLISRPLDEDDAIEFLEKKNSAKAG